MVGLINVDGVIRKMTLRPLSGPQRSLSYRLECQTVAHGSSGAMGKQSLGEGHWGMSLRGLVRQSQPLPTSV